MTDVFIHRCTLRVVRRGGWNWGPNPRLLVDRMVREMPALLAKVLVNVLPDEGDLEIAAPVRVSIPMRSAELGLLSEDPGGSSGISQNPFPTSLTVRMENALRDALAIHSAAFAQPSDVSEKTGEKSESRIEESRARRTRAQRLERILMRLREQGELPQWLKNCSLQELEVMQLTLRGGRLEPADLAAVDAQETESQLLEFFSRPRVESPSESPEEILRRRIFLAVDASAQFRVPIHSGWLWELLDKFVPANPATFPHVEMKAVPFGAGAKEVPAYPVFFGALERTTNSPSAPVRIATRLPRRSSEWEVHVSCALPFLLLGPLASLDFFPCIAAALQAAKIPEAGHLLAASLAYKVLDPPERGWRRTPASLAAAAAFAGRESPVEESEIAEMARQIAPYARLLHRLNAEALLEGHTLGEPLVICRAEARAGRGFMLLDAQGCFPLRWSNEVSELAALFSRVKDSAAIVASNACDPSLLKALGDAGVVFLVDANPLREERWQRLPAGLPFAGWTNHSDPESANVLRAAMQFSVAAEEASTFWQQIGTSRVSAVNALSESLDHSMSLAAGTALGTIAWKLWGERRRTSPQLALEHFRDLDAYVKCGAECLQVRLPLGRRHRELFEHGFLSPVEGAFWLGDRRVEYLGG
jgi:hypothetical protein